METIYTIPINEAFDASAEKERATCPLCLLYSSLEEKELGRILGAAMMEPDVRIRTNAEGFCLRHYKRMFGMKNRLGLALMMESHLAEIEDRLDGKGIGALRGGPAAEATRQIHKLNNDCYVCNRISDQFFRMADTLFYLYDTDPAFRKKFAAQRIFCLPHYEILIEEAQKKLPKKLFPAFYADAHRIEKAALLELKNDVSWFCKKFDYRYEDEPWYQSKDAVNRTIGFFGGTEEEL